MWKNFFKFDRDLARNGWRKLVWKMQQTLGMNARWPVLWTGCKLKSFPSEHFTQTLNAAQRKQLSSIVTEVELLSCCYNYFPEHLSDVDWRRLLQCETQKQRFSHVKFCRQKELKEMKCEKKRQLKTSDKPKILEPKSGLAMFIGTTQQKRIADQRRLMNHMHNCQLDPTPALIVDCRFLNELSPQALSQTFIQLSYLASENRDRRRTWPLYFCNFDLKNANILEGRDRYLSMVNSPRNISLSVSSSSYLDFFSPQQVIYLSPHAEVDLEEVEGSKVYVLGGIVDRVAQHRLHPQATLLAAQQDGVEVRRLPLDKYIEWKSGSKSMTLLAVTSILYSVYESGGDWKNAFRKYVPVRNIRGPETKNSYGRYLHAQIHDYERRLLSELNERLQMISENALLQHYSTQKK